MFAQTVLSACALTLFAQTALAQDAAPAPGLFRLVQFDRTCVVTETTSCTYDFTISTYNHTTSNTAYTPAYDAVQCSVKTADGTKFDSSFDMSACNADGTATAYSAAYNVNAADGKGFVSIQHVVAGFAPEVTTHGFGADLVSANADTGALTKFTSGEYVPVPDSADSVVARIADASAAAAPSAATSAATTSTTSASSSDSSSTTSASSSSSSTTTTAAAEATTNPAKVKARRQYFA